MCPFLTKNVGKSSIHGALLGIRNLIWLESDAFQAFQSKPRAMWWSIWGGSSFSRLDKPRFAKASNVAWVFMFESFYSMGFITKIYGSGSFGWTSFFFKKNIGKSFHQQISDHFEIHGPECHHNLNYIVVNLQNLPSRELTYPTLGKGESSSIMPFLGDMLVPWRVYRRTYTPFQLLKNCLRDEIRSFLNQTAMAENKSKLHFFSSWSIKVAIRQPYVSEAVTCFPTKTRWNHPNWWSCSVI